MEIQSLHSSIVSLVEVRREGEGGGGGGGVALCKRPMQGTTVREQYKGMQSSFRCEEILQFFLIMFFYAGVGFIPSHPSKTRWCWKGFGIAAWATSK